MPSQPFSDPIRRLWGRGTVSGLCEGALLDRFLKFEDESAFEAILSRHGPMVLAVCRRFLRDPHDVDDAFQATFLVLVRKASGLRDREALGPWLYGVAYRVAARARSRSRASGEDPADPADTRADAPDRATERAEAAEALHEELARLAGTYRDPIVLCHLEGLTHEQAAERLNWPVGTVRGRLWRGREKLRERLARRGFGDDPQTLLDTHRANRGAQSVPAPLIPTTLLAASRLAAGGPLRLITTPSVAVLLKGVLGAMFWNSIKGPIVLAIVLGVVGVGAATTAQKGRHHKQDPAEKPAPAPAPEKPPQTTGGESERPDYPPNLPIDYYPEVKDDDAPEKARAAQKAYDDQLRELTQNNGEIQGELQVLEITIAAMKKSLESNLVALQEHADDEEQLKSDRLREAKTRNELIQNIAKLQAVRERAEETEQRLQALKDRPRPTDRVEVQPGDRIRIEVLEALPGRPITGERWVRPDGKVSLDFYGDLYVAGMTTDEIKEKVILKLRRILADSTLGLVQNNPETDKLEVIQPRNSDRVYVDFVPPSRPGDQRTNRIRP